MQVSERSIRSSSTNSIHLTVSGTSEVDIVLDEPHPAVTRPALLVVVPNQILVVRIRVGAQVSLDQVARFIGRESEHDMYLVDVTRVQPDRVTSLGGRVTELQEIVGHLRRTCHLASALQSEDQDVENKTVVLYKESSRRSVPAMKSSQGSTKLTWKMKLENCKPRIIP